MIPASRPAGAFFHELPPHRPVLFVALCLGLSGLVLHRQIAAHPVPRQADLSFEPGEPFDPGDGQVSPHPSKPVGPKGWPVAPEPVRRAALAAISSQLAAIRAGDADRAWFYQSRGLHRNFTSAQAFEQEIQRGFPEFGHNRSAAFSPVWVNKTGDQAAVIVTVLGEDGHRARGYYRLIREGGEYKIAGVSGGQAIQ